MEIHCMYIRNLFVSYLIKQCMIPIHLCETCHYMIQIYQCISGYSVKLCFCNILGIDPQGIRIL